MTPYVAAENRGDVYLMPTWAPGAFFLRNARKSEFVGLERACALLRDAGRLGEGAAFVDVGAHIGTSVIPALTQHGFARGVAIEPDPDNFRLLRVNLELNGLHERVAVVRAAVSGTPGQLWFVPGEKRGGWARGRLSERPTPDAERVEVATLDSLTAAGLVDPAATGLLWLGRWLDDDAFLAASTFVQRRVPIVFVLLRNWLNESSAVIRALELNGYEQAVDLRRPSLDEPVSAWPHSLQPIRNLATMTPRKRATDVLVF
jgi:FkbM family methyltransferase